MPVTVNPHKMQRNRKLLGWNSLATKLKLGRWNWSKEESYPSSDYVGKAPLCNHIEWADMQAAPSRPLIEPMVEVSDKEKTTLVSLAAPRGNGGPSGTHIEAVPIIARKALPYEVAPQNYAMMCTVHCYCVRRSKQCPKS